MPIAGEDDEGAAKAGCVEPFIERRHNSVAIWHGQSAAGTKVALHIDNQERVV
jgi:hypothetical protein